jgi:hypothetical protein
LSSLNVAAREHHEFQGIFFADKALKYFYTKGQDIGHRLAEFSPFSGEAFALLGRLAGASWGLTLLV